MPTLRASKWPGRGALVLASIAVLLLADAGYLHAKAVFAQVLLERAWQQSMRDGSPVKPWPWADAAPVARLSVARLAVTRIVLSGDSGRSLAFAPGWSESTAYPGASGASVISAHRDTHFRFLRDLVVGDRIELQGPRGTRDYRVDALRVVDSRHARIDAGGEDDRILLVTCYPFDAFDARGPLRYLVEAGAITSGTGMRATDRADGRVATAPRPAGFDSTP